MEILNDDCLRAVFVLLGPKEWLNISKVCNKWRQIISSFWNQTDTLAFNHFYTNDKQWDDLTKEELNQIVQRIGPHINNLTVINAYSKYVQIQSHFYVLQDLNQEDFLEIIENLATNSGNIRSVYFEENFKVLSRLAASNNQLESLTLDQNEEIVSDNVTFNSVKELTLYHSEGNGIKTFLQVVPFFPQLKTLHLDLDCHSESKDVDQIFSVLLKFPHLENFRLIFYGKKSCLNRYTCLKTIRKCKKLHTFYSNGISFNECLDVVLSAPKMESFTARGYIFNIKCAKNQKPMKSLKTLCLDFFHGPYLNDLTELCDLIEKMPLLQKLSVDGISSTEFQQLALNVVQTAMSQNKNIIIGGLKIVKNDDDSYDPEAPTFEIDRGTRACKNVSDKFINRIECSLIEGYVILQD